MLLSSSPRPAHPLPVVWLRLIGPAFYETVEDECDCNSEQQNGFSSRQGLRECTSLCQERKETTHLHHTPAVNIGTF